MFQHPKRLIATPHRSQPLQTKSSLSPPPIVSDTTVPAPAASRAIAQWCMAAMFTIGSHLAIVGGLAQWHWSWQFPQPDREHTIVSAFLPPHLPPPIEMKAVEIKILPAQQPPKRLARAAQEGSPTPKSPRATAGPLVRHSVSRVATPRIAPILPPSPLRKSQPPTPTPDAGVATLPEGAGGVHVSLKPNIGERKGECVVFLFDNAVRGADRKKLQQALLSHLGRLHSLQYFYIIAYDTAALRMFSQHSPELRPMAPTREHRWQATRWLQRMEPRDGVAGAKWAIVHGLQMKPNAIHVYSAGAWPDAATGYLRSTNLGPLKRTVAPVHFTTTAAAGKSPGLVAAAQENQGTVARLGLDSESRNRQRPARSVQGAQGAQGVIDGEP